MPLTGRLQDERLQLSLDTPLCPFRALPEDVLIFASRS
jgi:hypothetical protein